MDYSKEELETLQKSFPFLTLGKYADNDYIGIVQSNNNKFISLYLFTRLGSKEDQEDFLEFGQKWWWESNRMIPINIFLASTGKDDFSKFSYTLQTFIKKDFELIIGPTLDLKDLNSKRLKRRTISVKRTDSTSK